MPGLGDDLYGLLAGTQYAGGMDPRLKQHFQQSGRGMMQGMDKAFSDAGPITPGPNAVDTMLEARRAGLAGSAGLNDIGQEKTDEWLFPAPIPQDPRMLAFQNQQNAQLAQQAWNRPPPPAPPSPGWSDPASGTMIASPEAQQPPAIDPNQQSFADMIYGLMSPAFSSGNAGPRY